MSQGELFPLPGPTERIVRFDVPDAELELEYGFLSEAESAALFSTLRDHSDWEQERAVMYGREVLVPRLTAWYGDRGASYVYSGVRHDPVPMTASLLSLRDRVAKRTGHEFNSVLLNYYRDGRDSVAWHSDDEPELGSSPVIASVSLGASRVFQLRHELHETTDTEATTRLDIELPSGSLLIMAGACQRHWKHQLPKRRGRNAPGPRINLTFRRVYP